MQDVFIEPNFHELDAVSTDSKEIFIFKTCSFMVLIKEGNSELVAQARKKKSIFDCSRFDKKKLQRLLLRAHLFPSNISNMCSFMLAFIFCYDLFLYVLVLIWEMQVHFANSNYFLICSKISKAYLLVQKKSYAEFLIINISSDLFCARWFDAYFQVPQSDFDFCYCWNVPPSPPKNAIAWLCAAVCLRMLYCLLSWLSHNQPA